MNDKHPTPADEQAEQYAKRISHENLLDSNDEAHLRIGYVAGHASRNSEVEELKATYDELFDALEKKTADSKQWCQKAMESANQRLQLQKEITALKERIKQLEGPEDDIYDAVAQYRKDHSNDTEGSKGQGC